MTRNGHTIIEGRAHGPAVEAAGDGLDGLYEGTLTSSPSGGHCKALIEGLDPYNDMDVYCRADASGSVGNIVLVGFSDQKTCILILNLGRDAL